MSVGKYIETNDNIGSCTTFGENICNIRHFVIIYITYDICSIIYDNIVKYSIIYDHIPKSSIIYDHIVKTSIILDNMIYSTLQVPGQYNQLAQVLHALVADLRHAAGRPCHHRDWCWMLLPCRSPLLDGDRAEARASLMPRPSKNCFLKLPWKFLGTIGMFPDGFHGVACYTT